jgi:hypothetical protein
MYGEPEKLEKLSEAHEQQQDVVESLSILLKILIGYGALLQVNIFSVVFDEAAVRVMFG